MKADDGVEHERPVSDRVQDLEAITEEPDQALGYNFVIIDDQQSSEDSPRPPFSAFTSAPAGART